MFDQMFRVEGIAEAYELVREFALVLIDIPQMIKIRIYRNLHGDAFMFTQSHFIQTPDQMSPYTTSVPGGSTEEEALRRAIATIMTYYSLAVRGGHTPSNEWLVPNKHF
jgi:hypothetical protein